MELKNSSDVRKQSLVALREAIKIVGTANKLALLLGISPTSVKQWIQSGKHCVNAKYVIAIEKLTEGKVKRYDLRCDIYPERDNYFGLIKKAASELITKLQLFKIEDLTSMNPEYLRVDVHYRCWLMLTGSATHREIIDAHDVLAWTCRNDIYKSQIFCKFCFTNDSEIVITTELWQAFFALNADISTEMYDILYNNSYPSKEITS